MRALEKLCTMKVNELPRELLIHVLRHAATDEATFFQTTTSRTSVCRNFAAAAEAWMISADTLSANVQPVNSYGQAKISRYSMALRLIRTQQRLSTCAMMDALRTQDEAPEDCAAFDLFTSSLLEATWRLRADWSTCFGIGSGPPSGWIGARQRGISANQQANKWPRPDDPAAAAPFRMHLRRSALYAAVHAIEGDAVLLLQASLQAALHRYTSADCASASFAPSDPATVYGPTVGANDVRLAALLVGRLPQAGYDPCVRPSFSSNLIPTNPQAEWNLPYSGADSYAPSTGFLAHARWNQHDALSDLRRLAALLPTAQIDRVVCAWAKRAGICRHTPDMIDAVWQLVVERYATALHNAASELRLIALREAGGDEEDPVEYEASSPGLRKLALALHDDEEEDDEEQGEEEEGEESDDDDPRGDPELGDDADVRWDEEEREWVILPSSTMFERLYGCVAPLGCVAQPGDLEP